VGHKETFDQRRTQEGRDRAITKLAHRASNAPQLMRARRVEAMILEKMPANTWMACSMVSRLIGADDDRKTLSRLDRLVRDGKISCKRERGTRGLMYLFCKLP
jgi:hypothetical protein